MTDKLSLIADKLNIGIVNHQSGEIFRLDKAKEQEVKNLIASFSDPYKSELLTKVNFFRRVTELLEKVIKGDVKSRELEFDDQGHAYWEDFKLTKSVTRRFNEKKLMSEGSEAEKKSWLKLKDKYTVPSESISF